MQAAMHIRLKDFEKSICLAETASYYSDLMMVYLKVGDSFANLFNFTSALHTKDEGRFRRGHDGALPDHQVLEVQPAGTKYGTQLIGAQITFERFAALKMRSKLLSFLWIGLEYKVNL